MTPDEALVAVAERLRHHGVAFALVGGLAVSIRGEVRFTRDVDLAIAVADDQEADRLSRTLVGDGFAPVAVVEHDERKRLAIMRMRSPQNVIVDLLVASSGIEREIVHEATMTAEYPGVPVACAEHLLALKVLSMRDARMQDRIDAHGLLRTAAVQIDLVRTALALMTERGYARGQDLEAKLEELLRESTNLGW